MLKPYHQIFAGGRIQMKLIAYFCNNPEAAIGIRPVSNVVGEDAGCCWVTMKKLMDVGLVEKNGIKYSLNKDFLIWPELGSIYKDLLGTTK